MVRHSFRHMHFKMPLPLAMTAILLARIEFRHTPCQGNEISHGRRSRKMTDLFHEFRVRRLLQASIKGEMKLIPSRT
jgi:hypothetical protein